jgi:hypothetical protein
MMIETAHEKAIREANEAVQAEIARLGGENTPMGRATMMNFKLQEFFSKELDGAPAKQALELMLSVMATSIVGVAATMEVNTGASAQACATMFLHNLNYNVLNAFETGEALENVIDIPPEIKQ